MNSNKTIVFRADGNSKTGLGHIYRLFALVEIYKSYFDVVFVTKQSAHDEIIPKEYNPLFIPSNIDILNEPEWLKDHFSPLEFILIADGYQFDSAYQRKIKKRGFKLIYVDDLIEGTMYADIVINHAANINPAQYKTSTRTYLALGTNYAILRPSFINAAKNSKSFDNITDAFVCFGGADPLDLSLKATKALLKIPQINSIHVVLGAAYSHCDIFDLQKNHMPIQLYTNLNEQSLCNLMGRCQLAIAPASTVVYELCAVKMPILSGYFVDNQKNIYNALLQEGAIFGCGDISHLSSKDFEEQLEKFLAQTNLESYLITQQRLFDGQSPNRFMNLINNLLVSFRKATEEDMDMIYEWSNDPVVRYNSYNSEPIPLQHHKTWFSRKINDENTLFLVALYDGKPAGIVRYELAKDHAVVGVLISTNFRGRKLATSFLSESAKQYFKQNNLPIFAYIKQTNKASIKAFESSGYSFYKEEMVKGVPSFVYKRELHDQKR